MLDERQPPSGHARTDETARAPGSDEPRALPFADGVPLLSTLPGRCVDGMLRADEGVILSAGR